MSSLAGKTPAATYKDLLQVSNSNAGIDSTLRVVSDGEGTESPLFIASTGISMLDAASPGMSFLQTSQVTGFAAISFDYATTDASDFRIVRSSAVWNTHNDPCLFFGYNLPDGGAGRRINGQPSLYLAIEGDYWPNVNTGQSELYYEYFSRDGMTTHRPFSIVVNNDTTGAIEVGFTYDKVTWIDRATSTLWFTWDHQYFDFNSASTAIRVNNNAQAFLKQINADYSGFKSLIYLNGADTIVLGESGLNGVSITSGGLTVGGGLLVGYTSSASTPTSAEYPANKNWGIHKDTNTGSVYLTYNDSNTIKKVELT